MAANLSIRDLRNSLRSPENFSENTFQLLKNVSAIVSNNENSPVAREMVLRILDRRNEIPEYNLIIDGLAREVGLFPYVDSDELDLSDRLAYEYHKPLSLQDDIVFHREQAHIYRRLLAGDSVILSAPTSFGKSKIIDAMVASKKYKNIAVIVPTLALIDETRRRLSTFSNTYKIVTSLSQSPGEQNIFVFTAERAVAYQDLPKVDFFVIDEFYKIASESDNDSRAIALNQAFYRLRKQGGQFYLLGPNIEKIPDGLESAFQCIFYNTNYSTVVAEQIDVPQGGTRLQRLINLAPNLDGSTLIFCSSPPRVNEVARALVESGMGESVDSLRDCAKWVGDQYHPEWIYSQALPQSIGIHHGKLPRSLAQFTVRAFNDERLKFLVCTSTLIEGVNTKAKNVIIYDNKIASRNIDHFTFNNIKGRSGRMFQHFIGRVYLFDNPPEPELPYVDFPVFTQLESTPDTLLIQLDSDDLTTGSKNRVSKYSEQQVLPMSILRQNAGIDPADQIQLASAIRRSIDRSWPLLSWTGFPKRKELRFVCELIWTYFVKRNARAGVFSGKQLAYKVSALYQGRDSTSRRVADELNPGRYAAKSADEAVERVLDFDRRWAGFHLPRFLMAVSLIQSHVLREKGLPCGDYSTYAVQMECLFKSPIVAALDEYGIPIQIAEKLQAALRTAEDLDSALARLKTLNLTRIRLTPFEREIVQDAQSGI